MTRTELNLKPVDFITIGTIGPKGKRVFHLQAGYKGRIITFIIEKEQAWALSEAINEFVNEFMDNEDNVPEIDIHEWDMDLREPIEPMFRIAQMGLAFDEAENQIILVAQEIVLEDSEDEPDVVRMWCTQEQMQALSTQASEMVQSGRADAKQNGNIIYYWT